MPWKVSDPMSLRVEFVTLAEQGSASMAELCRRFGVSRKTGYKWLNRHRAGRSLAERSRRPRSSPRRTAAAIEQAVLAVRDARPCWGGRKIAAVLEAEGHRAVPSPSTITEILRRHGRLSDSAEPASRGPWHRFEHARPNDLWQMDFKGHFGLGDGRRCHPLTVLDDHSRYSLAVRACVNERTSTVRSVLTDVFRRYGLPRRMLMDNGSPWGGLSELGLTPLTVWLLRLDVGVAHGRAFHPQTQGKDERFHRTLKLEALRDHAYDDQASTQAAFDRFRHCYNHERPHEALAMDRPAQRYAPSARAYPESLPELTYPSSWPVRRVQKGGRLHVRGRTCRVPEALAGQAVALEPTADDGLWQLWLGRHVLGELDLRPAEPRLAVGGAARCAPSPADSQAPGVTYVPEQVSPMSPG